MKWFEKAAITRVERDETADDDEHAALTVGLFTMPSQFSRGLAHPAISLPCLCETEGVKSPLLTVWVFLVHWRRRGYARRVDLFRIICILRSFMSF